MIQHEVLAFLVVYAIVALGAALGTVPRKFFRHPVERFVVRVSCGLMWPMFVGHLLTRAASTAVNRDDARTRKDNVH